MFWNEGNYIDFKAHFEANERDCLKYFKMHLSCDLFLKLLLLGELTLKEIIHFLHLKNVHLIRRLI